MSAQPDLDAFIAGLPKAELHVHPVGSASPRIRRVGRRRSVDSGDDQPNPGRGRNRLSSGLLPWLVVAPIAGALVERAR